MISVDKIMQPYGFLPDHVQHKLRHDLRYLFSKNLSSIDGIYLFGSYARNQATVTSDLDLLILSDEELSRELRGDIAAELEESIGGISTDVVFYTAEKFETSDCLLVKQIRKDGLMVWKKTPISE